VRTEEEHFQKGREGRRGGRIATCPLIGKKVAAKKYRYTRSRSIRPISFLALLPTKTTTFVQRLREEKSIKALWGLACSAPGSNRFEGKWSETFYFPPLLFFPPRLPRSTREFHFSSRACSFPGRGGVGSFSAADRWTVKAERST